MIVDLPNEVLELLDEEVLITEYIEAASDASGWLGHLAEPEANERLALIKENLENLWARNWVGEDYVNDRSDYNRERITEILLELTGRKTA